MRVSAVPYHDGAGTPESLSLGEYASRVAGGTAADAYLFESLPPSTPPRKEPTLASGRCAVAAMTAATW